MRVVNGKVYFTLIFARHETGIGRTNSFGTMDPMVTLPPWRVRKEGKART